MFKRFKEKFVGPYRFLAAALFALGFDATDSFERIIRSLQSLSEHWQSKAMFGAVLALLAEYNNSEYITVAQSIFWLVILDIITKFFAISNKNLIDKGVPQEQISTWDKFVGWLLAFHEHKITSAAMTLGFVSKITQFAIILTAAYYIDNSINSMKTQLPVNAVTFCVGYIFYSEFLSIVENMRDSGVAHMDKLCELLTSNIFNKLKK